MLVKASDFYKNRIWLDVPDFDSITGGLDPYEIVCLVGDYEIITPIVELLSIRCQIAQNNGTNPKSIRIDAGNCTNTRLLYRFARRYGLQPSKALDNVIISRPFTAYQTWNVVVNGLYKEKLGNFRLIVASYLTRWFDSDRSDIPHYHVGSGESNDHVGKDEKRELFSQILQSLSSTNKLVVITLERSSWLKYRSLVYRFANRIFVFSKYDKRNRCTIEVYHKGTLMKTRSMAKWV